MVEMLCFLCILVLRQWAAATQMPSDPFTLIMNQFDVMAKEIKQLEADNGQLGRAHQKLVQQINEENKQQKIVNQELSHSNDRLVAEVEQLKSENAQLKSMLHQQNQTVQHLSEILKYDEHGLQAGRHRVITDTVAFSAYVTHDFKTYAPAERIMFAGEEYNSGNFNVASSEFTCPTSGLYWFNFNIYFYLGPDYDHQGGAELMMQGSTIARVYTFSGGGDDQYGTMSNSVITTCSRGHVLHIQATVKSGISNGRLTTFNGLLLALAK